MLTAGDTMTMEIVVKDKPPKVKFYILHRDVSSDPRSTVTYDRETGNAKLELRKCKNADEAKWRVQVEDEENKCLDFAGFSVFVKGKRTHCLHVKNVFQFIKMP